VVNYPTPRTSPILEETQRYMAYVEGWIYADRISSASEKLAAAHCRFLRAALAMAWAAHGLMELAPVA